MWRVLFTGLGSIGRRHLRLLRERDETFDVHAYRSGAGGLERADGDDLGEAAAGGAGSETGELGENRQVTEHATLARALETQPDIAFITNPTALHVETAMECARAGCHLFIEKPLSHSLDGVDELVREVESNNLRTHVGCQLRYHPALCRTASLIEAEAIGPVYGYRAYSGSYLPHWRPDRDYRSSYSADPDMGGGVVLDLIHEIDYCHWLFGEVAAVTGTVGQVSDLEIESEDVAEIALDMADGSVGAIHLDYYRPVPRRSLEVTGRDGVITADLVSDTLTIDGRDGREVEEFEVDTDDLFRAQLSDMLTAIETGEECANDIHQAKRVLQIALEVRDHG